MRVLTLDELRSNLEQTLRSLQEEQEPVLIIDGGHTLARIVPEERPRRRLTPQELDRMWEEHEEFAADRREEMREVTRRRRSTPEELDRFWERIDGLADDIGSIWPEGVSAVDAVREQRHDL